MAIDKAGAKRAAQVPKTPAIGAAGKKEPVPALSPPATPPPASPEPPARSAEVQWGSRGFVGERLRSQLARWRDPDAKPEAPAAPAPTKPFKPPEPPAAPTGPAARSAEVVWGSRGLGGEMLRSQLKELRDLDTEPEAGPPVDLSTPETRTAFLAGFRPSGDGRRCESILAIAGLILQGGEPRLRAGVEMARSAAKGLLADGELTRPRLDRLAEALHDAYGTDLSAMEAALGLAPGAKRKVDPKDERVRSAKDIFDGLRPGEVARVAVHSKGIHVALGRGPNGEAVKKVKGAYRLVDPKSGKPGETLTGGPDGAALFGRTPGGTRYIYNPLADPALIDERSDPALLDRLAAALMPVDRNGDPVTRVTRYT
jgi:hypothetical protein